MSLPSAPRRHVFHLLPRLNEDGTTHMVATLLKGMDRQKYRVTLCGLSPGDAELATLQDLADEIHVLDMRHFFDPRVILPLYRLLKDAGVDVLHTHRIRPDIVGRIAGRMARIPVNISTQHYVEEWSERGALVHRVVRRLFNWTMVWCASVACNSAAEQKLQRRELDARYHARTCVIHNGLDTERFIRPAAAELTALKNALQLPDNARIVSVVAYLTERKGHRYLLEAVGSLLQSYPNLVLLIVGDGPEQARLMAQAESLGISAATRFLGNRREVPGILALSEVAVLPSLWEPFGLAALEAMALETAVVATTTGGPPEFIQHAENGYLVPPADAAALAQAISTLLTQPELARQIGKAAQATVMQGFTARHVAVAYESLYEKFLCATAPDDGQHS